MIYEGYKNIIILSPTVEKIAMDRAKICAGCPHAIKKEWPQLILGQDRITTITGLACEFCGCPISAMVRSIDKKCGDQKKPQW